MIILGSRQYKAMLQEIEALRAQLAMVRRGGDGQEQYYGHTRFKIVEIARNWTVCKYYDGATEGAEVKVIRPKRLRIDDPDNADGFTYDDEDPQVRTHDSSSDEQSIWPEYVEGEELTAALRIGGVGLAQAILDLLEEDDPDSIWLEVTPRDWSLEC